MAKNKNKSTNLILMIVSFVAAGLSFLGLALNFVSRKTEGPYGTQTDWSLSNWFETIDNLKNYDKIGSWQTARTMLIVAAILLVVVAVLVIVNHFVKNPIVKWGTFGVAIAVVVCTAIFAIMTFVGCKALTDDVVLATYFANIGAYFFTVGGLVAGACAAVVALRK